MNYATIKYYDIANGPGVRTSVFVSGCRHHCPGCFNAVAWDFDYGQPFDKPTRNEVFASCQPDYIAGLSLLGGEPMEPENQRELLPFVRNFKALYPNKTVWCYSGYTWEQLTGKEPSLARCEATDELLSLLGGEADWCVAKVADIAGRTDLKPLAAFSTERVAEYPDVPTLGEMGYYDKWLGSSRCICAPAGVSEEVVAFYEAAFKAAMEDAEYLAATEDIATDYQDAAATAALIAEQQAFTEGLATGFWYE